MKLTRRTLVALSAVPALSGFPAQAPQPAVPATPEEELAAARQRMRRNAEALAKFKIPMAAEPACVFKA